MKEDTLMKMCGVGSVICIIALYFISVNMEYGNMNIGEITGHMTGNVVNISGKVYNLKVHKDGHLFFDLADDTGNIKVVMWESVKNEMELSGTNISSLINGAELEITGTVEMYRGALEILPLGSRVKLI